MRFFAGICDAWDNKPNGIDHVTMGGIASVVGAARLLGLTQQQIIEAINITVAGNIALNQTRIGNVSKWKACGYANANRNAIFAAQLAARGMTGPSPIFEGRNGFLQDSEPGSRLNLRRSAAMASHSGSCNVTSNNFRSAISRKRW